MKPEILVDAQEPKSMEAELEAKGFSVLVSALPHDYILPAQEIFVERKCNNDFSASIMDKRLFEQLALLSTRSKPFIFLEGTPYQAGRGHGLPDVNITGMLGRIALDYPMIHILPTKNQLETVNLLWKLATAEAKVHDDAYLRFKRKRMGLKEYQHCFLQGLADVGPKRSAKLLETYHTPLEVICAIMKPDPMEGCLKLQEKNRLLLGESDPDREIVEEDNADDQ